ncbi:MAG: tRNA (adenosine(37)-N6)-threonylcarbamoyltransferase complex dimerization subunit type 1 TsaB [Paracoccaceae bacterium]
MPSDPPLILAFDTSAAHCAVALLKGNESLSHATQDMIKGQSECLMPMLENTLKTTGHTWQDLDLIAVGTGPGNFTGVRIAVATARGLALALEVRALGVSTFEALAYGTKGAFRVVLDGRRDQVFVQDFKDGVATNAPRVQQADMGASIKIHASAESIARFAAANLKADRPRPAPLYLRAPDAALPAEPAPIILP